MKVQMTGSYPCIAGTLNISTVAKAFAPRPPVTLANITLARAGPKGSGFVGVFCRGGGG